MGSAILNETIKVAMNVETSQKVKAWKRDQAYMVNTIEKLRQKVYNLQVSQAKPKQGKLIIPAESLQGTRD